MKVLFLDIDGVLNSEQSIEYVRRKRKLKGGFWVDEKFFCPIAVSNLQLVLTKLPDLKIVISSSWREMYDWEDLLQILEEHVGIKRSKIIDRTPRLRAKMERGHEIQAWLDENTKVPEGSVLVPKYNVTKFVILDDGDDMLHLKPFHVLTDADHGFMWKDAVKTIKILGARGGLT